MNTNFNRNGFQVYFEDKFGCKDQDKWNSYLPKVTSFIVDSSSKGDVDSILQEDAKNFLYSGTLSLFEGVNGIINKRYSWSVVKLYYSLYYLIRCELALNNYGLLRNKSLYYIKNDLGNKFIKNNSPEGNSTHKGTLDIHEKIFGKSDYYYSNLVEGIDIPYKWILDLRETINYRTSSFYEPEVHEIFSDIDKYILSNDLNALLEIYLDKKDKDLYLFSPSHTYLAVPLNKYFDLINQFNTRGISCNFSKDKIHFLNEYVKGLSLAIK